MPAMPAPLPLTRDIVLIGGGHAHALVLRRWGMDPLPGARLTVINPGPTAPYTGMLPGFVAGHYPRASLEIDLMRLARFAGARIILGMATALNRADRTITIKGRGDIAYDVASFDIGIHSDIPALPGFPDHGVAAKPLGRFAAAWAGHLDRMRADPGLADRGLAVLGAGVAGVELSMAMAHGGAEAAGRPVPTTLIDTGTALRGIGSGAARALRQRLQAMSITLIERTEVAALHPDGIALTDGRRVASGFTVGAAGARPYGWLAETGLALHDGFIRVDDTLRSVTDPDIFAVGDCAHMDATPRPKAGVFAVRQAPILAANLRAAVGAGTRRRYAPQRDYLKLISLGEKSAVADKFGLRLEGSLLWRWKDRIDRAFMDRLSDLPAMAPPKLPKNRTTGMQDAMGGKPLCGGCGSKLGRNALQGVLPGAAMDDAAILPHGSAHQVISTDHLRAFIDDPFVMARIAANHALGDIFAMGARPQTALATVILPRASAALHQRMLAEIMQAARDVMTRAGADISGGHTLIGDSLGIGFTVTGLVDRPITLAGARAGDALILTKPLGTGVIMAADMQLAAPGAAVANALDAMQQSQAGAARILAGAHAMTDITGFGLAGHLGGMLSAANLSAALNLADIPLLHGARALGEQGHRSTLYDDNVAATVPMTLPPGDPATDLLFDPQTAGGLLAAMPAGDADSLVAKLGEDGYTAAIIGHLAKGPPQITVTQAPRSKP